MDNAKNIIVTGSFDDLRSPDIRFLEEASKLGPVTVLVWPDEAVRTQAGNAPKFPLDERLYLLQNNRYVSQAMAAAGAVGEDALPLQSDPRPDVWAVEEQRDSAQKRVYCETRGIAYHVVKTAELMGFPWLQPLAQPSTRKKVMVTGCFDWFHSGHVRFFEEVSALGDLYVVVGSDQNVRLLKGEGHPLFPQDERRYVVQSVRCVTQALVSTGQGWMDAEPEINEIHPDIYAVNEDGDNPEKREFCRVHGLEYVVLKRLPKAGLARRQSTDLRGF